MNKVSKISRVAYMVGGAMLAACATAADLTLYADDGYQGRALNVVIDERELSVRNFNDRASSVVIESGAWVLCSGDDFGGKCVTLEPGRYASLRAVGLDDDVSSVRHRDPASIGEFKGAEEIARAAASADPGTDIVLYADDGYAGRSHSAGQPQADLQSEILQGKAASVVIAEGEWELCDDTYYRGQCVTLGPGKYPSLKTYGLTRGASSVRHAPPHR